MLSADWILALEKADRETRERAAKELLRVRHAIQQLENEELADLRDRLLANEAALGKGADQLAAALENARQVKAVAGLLATVARVVALIA